MSVSVRSAAQPSEFNARSSRHSHGNANVLRESAAKNILSNTMGGVKRTNSNMDRNMAVITIDELQRIRQQCTTGGFSTFKSEFLDEDAQRVQERLTLQEKSKARIANWPNTMHALRKKREEERYARLEAEELERRRIDALEFELQQQQRMKVVERANQKAYDN